MESTTRQAHPIPLHETPSGNVTVHVSRRLILALLSLAPAWAADSDISNLLKTLETRYNHAQTLETGFRETLTSQGRARTESGQLFLRKPGRMRWVYSDPAGKLFVSDGKNIYFYSPATNRAEKMKLKETEDMRAPMAFLLGKLDFQKDFKDFKSVPENGAIRVTALPKNDKMPYREVTFVVTPDAQIQRLIVRGQDSSVIDFTFTNEKLNPRLADSLFRFELPKGAEFVESTGDQEAH
jgi:outer membrane lipoprotein carrier protein